MKSMPTALIKQKRLMDYLLLMVCPAMVGVSIIIFITLGDNDIVKMYAWQALIVELLLCYSTACAYINGQGGPKRFGINAISAPEWFFSILLGVAVYCLFLALDSLLYDSLINLGMTRLTVLEIPGGWRLFACMFLIGILPAIAEETLLCGALLFTWLPHGKSAALWHSAALFALIQFQPYSLPLLLLVGFLFAYISARSGSCLPAIAMYSTNSVLSLLLAYLVSNNITASPSDPVFYGVIGILLGITAYAGLIKSAAKRREIDMETARNLYMAMRGALGSGTFVVVEKRAGNDESEMAHEYDQSATEPGLNEDYTARSRLIHGKFLVIMTYMFLLVFNGLYLAMLFIG